MLTDQRSPSRFRTIGIASLALISLIAPEPSFAEIKTITATGEYRMGDNDTRTDAKRLALLDAKRLALEQVGTYLESVTEVKNFGIARDELNAYTAGIVEVTELSTKDVLEGATHIIRAGVTVKIDTGVVARQIDALRKNETTKAELIKLRAERDQLKQEVEIKTRELTTVKSKIEAETIVRQRQQMLTKTDVNELLARAWVLLAGSAAKPLLIGESTTEDRSRARALIEQALALDPSSPRAHVHMGVLLQEEGKLDGAILEFREALRIKPDYALAHHELGGALAIVGDLDEAIAEYLEALRLEPDNASTHSSLGIAYAKKGNLDGAILEFRSAIHFFKYGAHYHFNLGLALKKKGDLDGAITELRVGLDLKPDDASAHFLLGTVLLQKGLKDAATLEFKEYLRLAPDTPDNKKRIEDAKARLRELE